MDLDTRLERFNAHVLRAPRTVPERVRGFVLDCLLYALGHGDAPEEAIYRGLAAQYAPNRSIAPYELEQHGLTIEAAWALVQNTGTEEELVLNFGVLTPLPGDFPHAETLVDAGILTYEALNGTPDEALLSVMDESALEDVRMAALRVDLHLEPVPEFEPTLEPTPPDPGGDPHLDLKPIYDGPYADELAEAGYTTGTALAEATDAELLAVKGLGKARLAEIRAHLEG